METANPWIWVGRHISTYMHAHIYSDIYTYTFLFTRWNHGNKQTRDSESDPRDRQIAGLHISVYTRVYVYTFVYISDTCLYTYPKHVCLCVYTRTCAYVYKFVCICIYMYTRLSVYVCMFVYAQRIYGVKTATAHRINYACMYVCMFVYIHAYLHVYSSNTR
jgi:hypothetical protein